MKKLVFALVVLLACSPFFITHSALCASPQIINYQGKLTDSSGQDLNGTYDLTFSLYTASTGGTSVWSEAHSSVTVTNGFFNVLLGSVNTNTLAAIFQANSTLYMEIKVGTETLSPRVQIGSAGYALSATNGPVAYGLIKYDGTVLASTPNVTSKWDAGNSRYEITIAGETFDSTNYVVETTIGRTGFAVMPAAFWVNDSAGKLLLMCIDSTPAAVQNDFHFVVYKP
jgi:hypothetical protein